MTFGKTILRQLSWWIMVMSLTVFSACCKNVRQAKVVSTFKSGSAVALRCPAEASSRGPILIEVSLDADARTYWDNQGVIDAALQIMLVRTDRPGLLSVAKSDPAAMMSPSSPLPGRPSEETRAQLMECLVTDDGTANFAALTIGAGKKLIEKRK
jgi:hypothetical protein